jgi:hypothetical protein
LIVGLFQKYHIVGSLMLCNLGLDDYQYHGAAAEGRLNEYVLPICLAVTDFYRQHYRLDTQDKLDMFPAQGDTNPSR